MMFGLFVLVLVYGSGFSKYPEYLVAGKQLTVSYKDTKEQGTGSLDIVQSGTPGSLAIVAGVPLSGGDVTFTVPSSLENKVVTLVIMKLQNATDSNSPKVAVVTSSELEVKSSGEPKEISSDSSTGNTNNNNNGGNGGNSGAGSLPNMMALLFLGLLN